MLASGTACPRATLTGSLSTRQQSHEDTEENLMSDVWLAASAICTLALAVVAFFSLRINERDPRESRQQAQDNLEASQRPYLYRFGALDVDKQEGGKLLFDFGHQDPG
jgi:hypothetical protein